MVQGVGVPPVEHGPTEAQVLESREVGLPTEVLRYTPVRATAVPVANDHACNNNNNTASINISDSESYSSDSSCRRAAI